MNHVIGSNEALYDTFLLEPGCEIADRSLTFFTVPLGGASWPSLNAKCDWYTNLYQSGMLGMPRLFRLEGLDIEMIAFDENAHKDIRQVYTRGVFEFVVNNRFLLRTPLTNIPAEGDIGSTCEFGGVTIMWLTGTGFDNDGLRDGYEKEFYQFKVCTKGFPDGERLTIGPKDAFSAGITMLPEWPRFQTTSSFAIRCYMRGMLYDSQDM